MARPHYIELSSGERIPILYEDRSVLAIDKPAGWMLVPFSWQKTKRNLQAALTSSIAAGDFWARSRSLRYLRFVHRLDAETSGILLLAKSPGALEAYSDLFERRTVEKVYLAVVQGLPSQKHWICRLKIARDPDQIGRMRVDARHGKDSETAFRLLQTRSGGSAGASALSLIEARPITGRTHQIRVHLAQSGHPVLGDDLYGTWSASDEFERARRVPDKTQSYALALRSVALGYTDPFTKRRVQIQAPAAQFLRRYGFDKTSVEKGT